MTLLALTGFLAVWNNVANSWPSFQRWYLPLNVGLTAGLVGLALGAGLGLQDLGLAAGSVGAGLVWGLSAAAVVGAVLWAGLRSPLRRRFRDERVARLSRRQVWWNAGVRIPFGTAAWEEAAFRGVLLAAWAAHTSTTTAVLVSSAVFGLWHVGPTLAALRENDVRTGRPRAVTAAVALTALAGVGFCLLRLVSGSLLAPILAHTATNSLAALASARAQGRI